MDTIQRIVPCLWFDNEAEQAAKHYIAIFDRSRIVDISHYGEAGHEVHGRKAGSVMTVSFELDGQRLTALNGGPQFKFSEAISLQVMCETQEEVDRYWSKLSAGGEEGPCGWLKDKFGLSWQVVPSIMDELMRDSDRARAGRVMKAMLQMKKLDIRALKQAAAG